MMRLENVGSFFEMDVAIKQGQSAQNHGDAFVTVNLSSGGFGGQCGAWVSGPEFSAFRAALVSLERSLKGEAMLESISPGSLKFKIYPANNRGHLAIEGSTGHHVFEERKNFWHSVSFGFTFEPQQLTRAMSLPWMSE
ncbi:hypothetical protein B0E51_08040 [Rhodanobacter sp. C05]|nr:hypothetical protein B0E51_08040 [Rhodanobacter sp. C05]